LSILDIYLKNIFFIFLHFQLDLRNRLRLKYK